MSDVRYNLSQLFELAFGVKNPVFIPTPVRIEEDSPATKFNIPAKTTASNKPVIFSGISTSPAEYNGRLSWMGTPIVYPFTLQGGTYKVFASNGELLDYQLNDFELPAATLVDFSRAKINIKTMPRGNNGSVKELFSFDDWRIRIRGICLDDPSRASAKTAQEQKSALLEWEQVCNSIPVIGSLFVEKKIYRLAIDGISFTQLERKPNVIPFEMECVSDEPLEMTL
ncbi:hypothetical protein GFS24_10255 [Chitinophaga sp. SYP-B3965]|uniref:DUF6046 domain-containing protein n=1 Tax=Chitinophaga sp. SYP-B3965 TaxID=2663120 RepID=UPI00129998F6|nr:DUF6046 domain-containing protein [Chitinophaga sp. SYP-B3965]MRG45499.1 hypothetical protein [Chitinophaga sp. SYP-B3965]